MAKGRGGKRKKRSSSRTSSRRSRRRAAPKRQLTLLGKFGLLIAGLGPVVPALAGNPAFGWGGAIAAARAGGLWVGLREFMDLITIQFVGIKVSDGSRWSLAQGGWTGWIYVGTGMGLVAADLVRARLRAAVGVRRPIRAPLVGAVA